MTRTSSQLTLHIVGLQRTGTNFINRLLHENSNVIVLPTGDRSVCWKHALPNEKGRNGMIAASAIVARPDIRIILVSKHPLTWWESISRRTSQDFLLKRTECRNRDGGVDPPQACKFYSKYYTAWLQQFSTSKFLHVRYEDALRSPEAVLQTAAARFGFDIGEEVKLPKRVPYSGAFTEDKKHYYLNMSLSMSDAERRQIFSLFDWSIVAALGYDLSSTVGLRRDRVSVQPGSTSYLNSL